MKIVSNIANTFRNITPKTVKNTNVSNPLNIKFAGLSQDVFEKAKPLEFSQIKLGERMNGGTEADVFEVLGTEEYVLRLRKGVEFSPRLLQGVFVPREQDDITVGTNSDGSVKILKRIPGEPLYGKDWKLYKVPDFKEYLSHLSILEKAPDKIFADYMKEIVELREKGFDIDRINPNNILYDAQKQKISIIDVTKKPTESTKITLDDLSPLVDGYRIGRIYKNLDAKEQETFIPRLQAFINRIVSIAEKEGIDIEIAEIDENELQSVLTYLYHNKKNMLI